MSVSIFPCARQDGRTRVADTGVVNLNANLVGLGGSDFDVLDGEGFTGTPSDGRLLLLVWDRMDCDIVGSYFAVDGLREGC